MKILKITLEIFIDVMHNVSYFIKSNLWNAARLIEFMLPYVMYFIACEEYNDRGGFAIGGEIFIPLIVYITTYFIRSLANKLGKGLSIPVPNKRFTEVDDDGEVSISYNRTQELILYVADLEDWMERKGFL